MNQLPLVRPNETNPLQRVTVLGAGLVGGSIALAARRAGCDVVLYDQSEETCALAREAGFTVAPTAAAACRDRDVVFICVPVDAVNAVVPMFRDALAPDCIVTDVASVKRPVRALPGLLGASRNPVILGHPMAGSHRSGFIASSADLFEGCTWLLCDAGDSPESGRLASLLHRLGTGRVLDCPADTHDTLTAVVSHLPQVVSSALAAVCGDAATNLANGSLEIAGGGFRDTTRIAESPFAMWQPILRANSAILEMLLRNVASQLETAASALHTGDSEPLRALFEAGNQCRADWRDAQPGDPAIVGTSGTSETPVVWADPQTGEQAWTDRSFGWETVRSSIDDPEYHAVISARYLAAAAGIDPGAIEVLTSGRSNAAAVAESLMTAGLVVSHRSTWTADGFHVEGVDLPDGRFVVII